MSATETAATGMVLAYHEVMPESSYAYCVTCDSFAGHLGMLGSLDKFSAQITFDYGEQSQFLNALPRLQERGISATCFVNPGLVGTEPKFLRWHQLRAVQAAGHSVQSHGWSHKFLTSCDDQELALELVMSREILQEKLGAAVEEISVPGGRWDRRVIEACASAGYKRVYVSDPWISEEMAGVKGDWPLHGASQHHSGRAAATEARPAFSLEIEDALEMEAAHRAHGGRRPVPSHVVPAHRIQRV